MPMARACREKRRVSQKKKKKSVIYSLMSLLIFISFTSSFIFY